MTKKTAGAEAPVTSEAAQPQGAEAPATSDAAVTQEGGAVQSQQAAPAAAEPTIAQATADWGELPAAGGCFVRQSDGTLIRDPAVHGEEGA